jgi:hypothetical protein
MIRTLTEEECRNAMEKGDFDPSLTGGPAAAIILTQSWCPQWHGVRNFLPEAEKRGAAFYPGGVSILTVEYDIAPWERLSGEDFMSFKESRYRNREIPYIRYYRQGGFYRDSNFISLQGFLERLGIPG